MFTLSALVLGMVYVTYSSKLSSFSSPFPPLYELSNCEVKRFILVYNSMNGISCLFKFYRFIGDTEVELHAFLALRLESKIIKDEFSKDLGPLLLLITFSVALQQKLL